LEEFKKHPNLAIIGGFQGFYGFALTPGWDFSFSRAGEPGICFDSELCLRAWLNRYQVGYRFVPFKGPPQHYSLDGGTMLFSKGVRFRNEWENHRKIFQRYSGQADQISELVKEANHSIGLTTD
jgi:hypothetical protein